MCIFVLNVVLCDGKCISGICEIGQFIAGTHFTDNSGMILGLRPPNERRRYFVTTPLIDWEQA